MKDIARSHKIESDMLRNKQKKSNIDSKLLKIVRESIKEAIKDSSTFSFYDRTENETEKDRQARIESELSQLAKENDFDQDDQKKEMSSEAGGAPKKVDSPPPTQDNPEAQTSTASASEEKPSIIDAESLIQIFDQIRGGKSLHEPEVRKVINDLLQSLSSTNKSFFYNSLAKIANATKSPNPISDMGDMTADQVKDALRKSYAEKDRLNVDNVDNVDNVEKTDNLDKTDSKLSRSPKPKTTSRAPTAPEKSLEAEPTLVEPVLKVSSDYKSKSEPEKSVTGRRLPVRVKNTA